MAEPLTHNQPLLWMAPRRVRYTLSTTSSARRVGRDRTSSVMERSSDYRLFDAFRKGLWLAAAFLRIVLIGSLAFSSYIWAQTVTHDWDRFTPANALTIYWPDWFVPPFLLSMACASLVCSIGIGSKPVPPKRLAFAKRLLVLTLFSACCFFGADVAFSRYQYSVDIATTEYWDSGGPEHVYYTWWWYNDRWFRASYWRRSVSVP